MAKLVIFGFVLFLVAIILPIAITMETNFRGGTGLMMLPGISAMSAVRLYEAWLAYEASKAEGKTNGDDSVKS